MDVYYSIFSVTTETGSRIRLNSTNQNDETVDAPVAAVPDPLNVLNAPNPFDGIGEVDDDHMMNDDDVAANVATQVRF